MLVSLLVIVVKSRSSEVKSILCYRPFLFIVRYSVTIMTPDIYPKTITAGCVCLSQATLWLLCLARTVTENAGPNNNYFRPPALCGFNLNRKSARFRYLYRRLSGDLRLIPGQLHLVSSANRAKMTVFANDYSTILPFVRAIKNKEKQRSKRHEAYARFYRFGR